MRLALLVMAMALCGCGVAGPEGTRQQLLSLAFDGGYLGWPAEPAVHQSSGPHGKVRSFVNPELYASMKGGNTTHPPGSIAVKELHNAQGVYAYAIDYKQADGTWVFFEGYPPSFDQYFFAGTDNLCANCHAAGIDYVVLAPSALP